MIPLQNTQWIHINSSRSLTSIYVLNNGGTFVLSRRVNRTTQEENILKPHVIMRNHYRHLEVGMCVAAWKDRASFLNSHEACADVELDNRVSDASDSSVQLRIFQLSFCNIKKDILG